MSKQLYSSERNSKHCYKPNCCISFCTTGNTGWQYFRKSLLFSWNSSVRNCSLIFWNRNTSGLYGSSWYGSWYGSGSISRILWNSDASGFCWICRISCSVRIIFWRIIVVVVGIWKLIDRNRILRSNYGRRRVFRKCIPFRLIS